MSVYNIVYICITAVGLLVSITTNIVQRCKSKKQQVITTSLDLEQAKAEIVDTIPSLVEKAEAMFGKGKGAMKLAYVMLELTNLCLTKNVTFAQGELEEKVNNVVKTTKKVNV